MLKKSMISPCMLYLKRRAIFGPTFTDDLRPPVDTAFDVFSAGLPLAAAGLSWQPCSRVNAISAGNVIPNAPQATLLEEMRKAEVANLWSIQKVFDAFAFKFPFNFRSFSRNKY